MPYSSFTFAKAKKDFGLTTAEGGRFLPPIDPIAPSSRLQEALERKFPHCIGCSFLSKGNFRLIKLIR